MRTGADERQGKDNGVTLYASDVTLMHLSTREQLDQGKNDNHLGEKKSHGACT